MSIEKTWEELFGIIAETNRRSLPILKTAPTGCDDCGACCEYYSLIDVQLDDENYKWLSENGYLADVFHHGANQMKQVGETRRCIALTGTVGVDARCSIYGRRPEGCQDYIVGAYRCQNAIIEKFYREKGCN